MAKSRGRAPVRNANAQPLAPPAPAPDYDRQTPKFCMRHLQPGFGVSDLDEAGRAAFAVALERRSRMTWSEITLAPRHGLGIEWMPASRIKPTIPTAFQDADRFLVMRYHGKLPLAGVRAGDVFHIVWIERRFGDLYPHG